MPEVYPAKYLYIHADIAAGQRKGRSRRTNPAARRGVQYKSFGPPKRVATITELPGGQLISQLLKAGKSLLDRDRTDVGAI